jgi:hypothetical protein
VSFRNVWSAFAMRCYPDMSTAEELAVEAVISEPVSVGIFPVKRENTGNFRRSSLKNAIGLSFRTRKSEGYGQIPCASEQGIFRS